MQHLTVKAATTAVDQELGQFTAIAAAWTVDRQGERIARGAFSDTIERWAASGKTVPLHWNHKAEAESIIGHVSEMKETERGLYVEGQLDIEDSEAARQVWRSVKRGRVSLSFGFMAKAAHDEGDVHVLDEIDLFEVSIVAAPANADTRILSTKAADPGQRIFDEALALFLAPPSEEELQARAKALDLDHKSKPIRVESFEC